MIKSELREYYFDQRKRLESKAVEKASEATNRLIINDLINDISSIHCFIKIPKSNEIDTWPLIKECWRNNISTATSISCFNPKRLEHSWFNEKTKFVTGKFNVPVPSPRKKVDLGELDLVIVPLLCIDNQGNRIGYGQGFYDSFLSKLPSRTKKIGVSVFGITDEVITPDPWDVPLDGVVTPSEKILF